MNTARFDQKDLSANPYARCKTCDIGDLATEELAHAHMREQRHTISILNPSRQDRIDMEVYDEISGRLDDIFESLYELIEDGAATKEEITRAIQMGPSIDGEWETYLHESEES